MDRHSGVIRGRRGDKKDGAGRGNWGKATEEGEGVVTEHKEGEEVKEGEEKKEVEKKEEVVEETVEEVVEEEEVKGMTLDDYMASRKKATQRKEARATEATKKDNIERSENVKEYVLTKLTSLRDADTHTIANGKSESNNLMQFQAPEEIIDFDDRRGGRGGARGGARGGRGGDRGAPRGGRGAPRGGAQGGQRQGRNLHMSEEAFPAL
jgi:plasminogen activator inhibitor 1 RNA-binding protein